MDNDNNAFIKEMKIVAIPDLHLGKSWKVTYGEPSVLEELPLSLVQSIISAEEDKNEPFILLFLGDVFDTSRPPYPCIFKFLSTIKENNTIVISGNHDIPKVTKTSVMDYVSDFADVISQNTAIEIHENMYALGWCDTQNLFENKVKAIIEQPNVTHLFLHGAYNNWDNEMDNVITDDLIKLAKAKGIKLISGHEHVFNAKKDTLFHLGSIMPMNIGELGPKYYWTSTEHLIEIPHGIGNKETDNIIFTRKEIKAQGNKPIVIRAKKTSSETLSMEKRDLSIDIIADFKEKALSEGFNETFLKEYLDKS
ncbi:MAG: metallophosphoesterase [Pelagibacterales bacterium]|nr:metallophosphoesterase [Pelagibacterales bacterium]